MITADQLLCHLVGDYVIQSDWMASEKTRQSFAASVHAVSYALPFLFLAPSLAGLIFIVATHFVIDRWRLARYVCWAKNQIAPPKYRMPWEVCSATGYSPDKPAWLAVWLLIIADNTLHLLCNGVALRWL